MSRKTILVNDVKDKINLILATDQNNDNTTRRNLIAHLVNILMDTGNYKGFRHLDINEIPAGHNPGIRFGENGEMLSYEERFKNTDNSRVMYM